MPTPDNRPEKSKGQELRRTTPREITDYFENYFDSRVRVQFAPKGETITIADGWHGAGKEGEVLVFVGDLLTKPISGTKLTAEDLLSWSADERFTLADGQDIPIDIQKGVGILEGNTVSGDDNKPVLRLTRTASNGVPVEIQFYGGATNAWSEQLTVIGNKRTGEQSAHERENYRDAVRHLFHPFISKGTTLERARLEVPDTVDKLRRVDDCAASMVTILGDQIIDDAMNIPRENLLEIHDLSIATTQAVVLAISMAERRHVPLVMRVGAPTFGLGSREGLNYMMNTLPELQAFGPMAVGDMGKHMDDGNSRDAQPNLVQVRHGDASRELRLFLGGGLPVSKMLEGVHQERGKPIGWDIAFRRAKRVDNGPDAWGVLISGTQITVRTARRDKSFISPNTELVTHDNEPWFVEKSGLWASIGKEERGFIPVTFVDRGNTYTLYKPAIAK